MKHFLYYDDETGEEFIVGAMTKQESFSIAKEYFEKPIYQLEMSDEMAEVSGLDEY